MSSTVCYKCNRTGHFARECSQGGMTGGFGGGSSSSFRGGRGGPRGGAGGGGFGRGECELKSGSFFLNDSCTGILLAFSY